MTWDNLADWIQAIGSVAAIIIAIWTVRQQANRERDNRVIDDAAFASYIKKFLSSDIEEKIENIADPDRLFRTGANIAQISDHAVERYETDVVQRLEKLVELPLTDWPDIELANSFNNAYLRMGSDLEALKVQQQKAAREADEELQRRKEAKRRAIAAKIEEDERLEEEADEYEGSIDDGLVVALPPRGQRHRRLERKLYWQADEDSGWEPYETLQQRDADEMAGWDAAWAQQDRQFAIDALKENLFEPLKDISNSWRDKDADLLKAIDRYIDRAERYHLPTTYDGRAERPKRLAPILR